MSIYKSRNKATLLNLGHFIEKTLAMRSELTERERQPSYAVIHTMGQLDLTDMLYDICINCVYNIV